MNSVEITEVIPKHLQELESRLCYLLKGGINTVMVFRLYVTARCSSVVERPTWDRSLMLGSLSYFSVQPVLHDLCNKDRGMCYPV